MFEEIPASGSYPGYTRWTDGVRHVACLGVGPEVRREIERHIDNGAGKEKDDGARLKGE